MPTSYTSYSCQRCGAKLDFDIPEGLCPACVLEFGLRGFPSTDGPITDDPARSEQPDSTTGRQCSACGAELPANAPETADSLKPPATGSAALAGSQSPFGATRSVGDYELLEEIARGGMGVVYLARQKSLDRMVALKMILAGQFAGPERVRRFRVEAEAAAQLRHPNIVAIHETGEVDGQPYFSMDYVEGRDLAALVRDKPVSARRAAQYVRTIAEAVHYAHERGILHRDLKPSNILIDQDDQPRVTDFGLAKRIEADSGLTVSGEMLGSPNFMPPEQAGLKRGQAGRQSDVYGLGGILFFLVTGRPPFVAETVATTLQEVLHAEPISPRTLNRGVPEDLATICLKCLAKNPAQRYTTAQEVADELGRFLRDEPIRARPATQTEKLWRWCRRKPALATACGFIALLGLVILIGSPIALFEINRARRDAVRNAEAESRERLSAENNLYAATLHLVRKAWEDNKLERVRELLAETQNHPRRGLEWLYWQRQLHRDIRTLRQIRWIDSAALFPGGRRFVMNDGKTARIWDISTGEVLLTLKGHTDGILCVAVSPDGRRVLTAGADHVAKVWDASDGREVLTLAGHTNRVSCAAFSSDGQRIVTGGSDQTVRVWDASSGRELLVFEGQSRQILSVAFSPDGRRILTSCWQPVALLYDAFSGREVLRLQGHNGATTEAKFSRDGQRIITGSEDRTAKIWDATSGRELVTLTGHASGISAVAISWDGQQAVTGSADRLAKVWEAATGRELLTLKGHTEVIISADFSPDGQLVVTTSGDATAKVWQTASSREFVVFKGHYDWLRSVAFAPSGDRLITGGEDQNARVWEASTGQELLALTGHKGAVSSVAVSPNGQWILTGSYDRTAKLWEASTGRDMLTLRGHSGGILAVAISGDGKRIATGSWDGTAKLWEASSGRPLLTLSGHTAPIGAVAFSPDGRRLVTGSEDQSARVWDLSSGQGVLTFKGHSNSVFAAGFSPDGESIVTGGADGTAKVWDASTARELHTLRGHTTWVLSVAYSADGQRLVTGSGDWSAKVWDAANGRELLTLDGHTGQIKSAVFSPDGQRIATASADGTARVWETASRSEIERWHKEDQAAAEQLAAFLHQYDASTEKERMRRRPDAGAVREWLMVAPIPAPAGQSPTDVVEQDQIVGENALRPRSGDTITVRGIERVWQAARLDDFVIDFQAGWRYPSHRAVAYAVCYLKSEVEQPDLQLFVGSQNQAKVYLNGEAVYTCRLVRSYRPDQDRQPGIRLQAGLNVLVFKIVSTGWNCHGSVRLADKNGQPVNGIKVTLDP
ncbi:MAG: protein kinase [Verrucomicrobia bacterium]|nr:protein kinase [Verrucomicrobiota bacterium]